MNIQFAPDTVTGLFVDDLITHNSDYEVAVDTLQNAVNCVTQWAQLMKINLFESTLLTVLMDTRLRS